MNGIGSNDGDVVPELGFDGAAAVRRTQRDADTAKLWQLVALPLSIVATVLLAIYAMVAVVTAGDFSQIRATAAGLMPEASAFQLNVLATALTVAYSATWHAAGSRGSAARAAALAAAGNAARPLLRGFGVAGVLYVAAGSVAMVLLAFSRGEVMARIEGTRAARRVADDALGTVDPAAVEEARARAVDEVFWPDVRWSLVVLGLLAVAALVAGFTAVPVKRAFQLGLARRGVLRRRLRLAELEAQESAAQCELVSRIEGRTRVTTLAEMHDRELPHRFTAAKERYRIALAARLAEPEATSELARRGDR